MNKIYKVIWSKAKHCYIVASEIAKSHSKSTSTGGMKKLVLSTLALLTLTCGGLVGVDATEVDQIAIAQAEASSPDTHNVYTVFGADEVFARKSNVLAITYNTDTSTTNVADNLTTTGNISSSGTVTATGFKVAGTSVSIDGTTFNVGKMKLANVADGNVTATSKQGVNGSQLYTEQEARINADKTLQTNIDTVSGTANANKAAIDNATTGLGATYTLATTATSNIAQLNKELYGTDGTSASPAADSLVTKVQNNAADIATVKATADAAANKDLNNLSPTGESAIYDRAQAVVNKALYGSPTATAENAEAGSIADTVKTNSEAIKVANGKITTNADAITKLNTELYGNGSTSANPAEGSLADKWNDAAKKAGENETAIAGVKTTADEAKAAIGSYDTTSSKAYIDTDKSLSYNVQKLDNAISGVDERVGTIDSSKTVYKIDANNTVSDNLVALDSELNRVSTSVTGNTEAITKLTAKTKNLNDEGTTLTGMTTVGATTVNATDVNTTNIKVTDNITDNAGNTTSVKEIKDAVNSVDTLNGKTTEIQYAAGTGTTVSGVTINSGDMTHVSSIASDNDGLTINGTKFDASGIISNVSSITSNQGGLKINGATFNADGAISDITSINGTKLGENDGGNYYKSTDSLWDSIHGVDAQVKTNTDAIGTNTTDIKALQDKTAGIARVKEGDSDYNTVVKDELIAKEDATFQKNVTVEGTTTTKTLDVKENATIGGTLEVTGKGTFNGGLEVTGGTTTDTLTVTGNTNLKNTKVDGTLEVTGTSTFADKATFNKGVEVNGDITDNAGNTTSVKSIVNTQTNTAGIERDGAAGTTIIEGNVTIDKDGGVTGNSFAIKDTGIKIDSTGINAGSQKITNVGDGELKEGSTDAVNGGQVYTIKTELETKITNEATARADADQKLSDRIGSLSENGNYIQKSKDVEDGTASVYDNLTKLDTALKGTDDRTAGITRDTVDGETVTKIEDKVTVDQKGNISGVKGLSAETITTTGDATIGGNLSVKGESTFEGDATFKKDLTVEGTLNVNKVYMENKTNEGNKSYDSYTDITADSMTNYASVKDTSTGITTESTFHHDETGSTTYAKQGNTEKWKETTSEVTADGVHNHMADQVKNSNDFTQTSTTTQSIIKDNDGNSSTSTQTAKKDQTVITDGKTTSTSNQTAEKIVNRVDGEKGSGVSRVDADKVVNKVLDADGKEIAKTKLDENGIANTTTGDITNTAEGTLSNKANEIINESTGNTTNTVGGTLTTTVEGKTTENYNGGLETNVTGDEAHTVTGDIKNSAKNITNTASESVTTQVMVGEDVKASTKMDSEGNVTTIADKRVYTQVGNTSTSVENGTLHEEVNDGDNHYDTTSTATESHTYMKTDTHESTTSQAADGTYTLVEDNVNNTATVTRQNGKDIENEAKDGTISNTAKDLINKATEKILNQVEDTSGNVMSKVEMDKDGNVATEAKGNITNVAEGDINNTATNITNTATESISNEVGTASTKVEDGKISEKIEDANGNHYDSSSTATDSHTYMQDKDGKHASYIGQQANGIGTLVVDNENGTQTSIQQTGKDITNTAADGTIKNDAKDIENNASGDITNTAGGDIKNSATNITNTASKKLTNKAEDIVNEASKSMTTTVKVGDDEKSKTVMDAEGNITTTAKETITTSAKELINKATEKITSTVGDDENYNKVESNAANGTTFTNTGANTAIIENDKTGTATTTTIKGNTISTGKATMDFAEVLKDLGVRGDAVIDGKTTTGSFEVKGESQLKGNTTIGTADKNADLTVNGNSTVTGNQTIGGTLDVAKKATFGDSVDIAKDLNVGGTATASAFKVSGTGISLDNTGLDMDNHKIYNVADGEIASGSKDAVNGGQLYGVKRDLETQIDKVGANAAAMANLRPMEFDGESKWSLSAAIGNYGSESAAALGAFYRPNEDVSFNVSTTFGTGENMFGGGVSVRLGKGGGKRVSRAENEALKAQVESLTARMDALLSVLNPNMSQDFPDVPENHWAYEAVSRLAGNGIVEGYPDGEFHGERTMSRYEMAEIIYNALSQGLQAEKDLVEEFKPELQAMAASRKVSASDAAPAAEVSAAEAPVAEALAAEAGNEG